MIKQFFESPTVGKWKLPYYQRNKYLPESKPTPTTVEEAHIAIQCTRLGLTKAIYLERCAAVVEQSNSCTFQVGDTVYPTKPKDKAEYGRMQVVGICRNYDHYGTVDWNNPPFILSVQSLSDRTSTINCTVGWVQSTLKENEVEC